MKTEQVKEGNEVIASIEDRDKISFFMYGEPGLFSRKFNWNDLMPVVAKITPLSKKVGQQAWSDTGYFLLDGNIAVVFERSISFINWYNSIKKA